MLALIGATLSPPARGAPPEPAPAPTLPELGRAAIAHDLDVMLKDLGDLDAYIYRVDGGDITVKTFSSETACVSLPTPTLMRSGVDVVGLERLERALEVFNADLARGEAPTLKGVQAACSTRLVARKPLPKLTPAEIQEHLASMLARMGDLAAYLGEPGPDGEIVVKTFAFAHTCRTLPPPLTPGQPMSKDAFTPLENAIRVVNEARLAHLKNAVPTKTVRAPCLEPAAPAR